jgi:hypothetical protein
VVAAPADRDWLADHHRDRAEVLDRFSRHHRSPGRCGLAGGGGGRVPARLGAAALGLGACPAGRAVPRRAIWAFVNPFGTFWSLAAVVGLLLILQGAFVLITSIESSVVSSVWWLGMISGIWRSSSASGPPSRRCPRAVLLIIRVGLFAMFRGFTAIVLAFEPKIAQRR